MIQRFVKRKLKKNIFLDILIGLTIALIICVGSFISFYGDLVYSKFEEKYVYANINADIAINTVESSGEKFLRIKDFAELNSYIEKISGDLTMPATVFSMGDYSYLQISGINAQDINYKENLELVEGSLNLNPNTLSSNKIIITEDYAKDNHLYVGSELSVSFLQKTSSFFVEGIVKDISYPKNGSVALADIKQISYFYGTQFSTVLGNDEALYTRLFVKLKDGVTVSEFWQHVSNLNFAKDVSYEIMKDYDVVNDNTQSVMQPVTMFCIIVCAMLFVVQYFILRLLSNRMSGDLFILRSLGARQADTVKFLCAEPFITSVAGAASGFFMAGLGIKLLLSTVSFTYSVKINYVEILIWTLIIFAINVILTVIPVVAAGATKPMKLRRRTDTIGIIYILAAVSGAAALLFRFYISKKSMSILIDGKENVFAVSSLLCGVAFTIFATIIIITVILKLIVKLTNIKQSKASFVVLKTHFNKAANKRIFAMICIVIIINSVFLVVNECLANSLNSFFNINKNTVIMNGNIDDYYDEINNSNGVKSVNQIYMRNGFIKNGSNFKEYMRIIGGNYEQLSYVLEPQLIQPLKDKIDNIKSNEVIITEFYAEYLNINIGDTIPLECNNVSAEFFVIGIVTTDINGGMLVFAGNETMNTVFGINYSNINFIQTDRELTSMVLNSFRKHYSALGIGVFDYEQFFEYDTHVYIQLMEFLNIFSKVLTVIVMAMVFLANYFNYLNEKENYLKLRLMGLNRKEQLKYGLIELALIMVVSYVVALGVGYLLFAILKQSALLLSAYIIKMPVLKNISFFTAAIAALMAIFNFMVYFSSKKENFNPILRKHW